MSKRTPLDAYFTPPWQTAALLKRFPIEGSVFEPCAGDLSIVRVLSESAPRVQGIYTNDIDPDRKTNHHLDAARQDSWEKFPQCDYVITNPPFNKALDIARYGFFTFRKAMVLLLRISFMEPTQARQLWLMSHPPHAMIVLPRWSYKGNGSTDSVTTAWFIWQRGKSDFSEPIQVVPQDEKVVATFGK